MSTDKELATARRVAARLMGGDTTKDDADWGYYFWSEARLRHLSFPAMFHTNEADWVSWPAMPHVNTVVVYENGSVYGEDRSAFTGLAVRHRLP